MCIYLIPFFIHRHLFNSINLIRIRINFFRNWHIFNIKTKSYKTVSETSSFMSICNSICIVSWIFNVKTNKNSFKGFCLLVIKYYLKSFFLSFKTFNFTFLISKLIINFAKSSCRKGEFMSPFFKCEIIIWYIIIMIKRDPIELRIIVIVVNFSFE